MYRISIGLLVAGVIAFVPSLTQSADLPAIQDTFTDATAPATNYGHAGTMRVQKVGTRVALIRFDLSSAAHDATEQTAVLRIKVEDVKQGGRIAVRRVLSEWQEGTVTFNTPLIVAPEVVATYDVKPEDAGRIVSIDVSAAAAAWRRSPEKNFGLSISAADFGGRGRPFFSLASREQDSAAVLSLGGAEPRNVVAQENQPDTQPAKGVIETEAEAGAQFLRR